MCYAVIRPQCAPSPFGNHALEWRIKGRLVRLRAVHMGIAQNGAAGDHALFKSCAHFANPLVGQAHIVFRHRLLCGLVGAQEFNLGDLHLEVEFRLIGIGVHE